MQAHWKEYPRGTVEVLAQPDELDPGVLSYAVPVHVEGAGVLYSVGAVGLSARLAQYTEAQLAGDLRAAAQSISARLSHG